MSAEFCNTTSFSEFVVAKNIPALSIGSIIGLSIAGLSASLSGDIVVPFASFLFRKDITSAHIQLKAGQRDTKACPYESYEDCKLDKGAINLTYGKFLSTIINVFIQILIVYAIVRAFCFSKKAVSTAIDVIKPVAKEAMSKTMILK